MNASAIASSAASQDAVVDFLPLEGTDYVEFYVGNAKQAAHYYMSAFGFQALAYAGPETGIKDRASYAVRQHKLTFVLTTALRPDHPIADHVHRPRCAGDRVPLVRADVEGIDVARDRSG